MGSLRPLHLAKWFMKTGNCAECMYVVFGHAELFWPYYYIRGWSLSEYLIRMMGYPKRLDGHRQKRGTRRQETTSSARCLINCVVQTMDRAPLVPAIDDSRPHPGLFVVRGGITLEKAIL